VIFWGRGKEIYDKARLFGPSALMLEKARGYLAKKEMCIII